MRRMFGLSSLSLSTLLLLRPARRDGVGHRNKKKVVRRLSLGFLIFKKRQKMELVVVFERKDFPLCVYNAAAAAASHTQDQSLGVFQHLQRGGKAARPGRRPRRK